MIKHTISVHLIILMYIFDQHIWLLTAVTDKFLQFGLFYLLQNLMLTERFMYAHVHRNPTQEETVFYCQLIWMHKPELDLYILFDTEVLANLICHLLPISSSRCSWLRNLITNLSVQLSVIQQHEDSSTLYNIKFYEIHPFNFCLAKEFLEEANSNDLKCDHFVER